MSKLAQDVLETICAAKFRAPVELRQLILLYWNEWSENEFVFSKEVGKQMLQLLQRHQDSGYFFCLGTSYNILRYDEYYSKTYIVVPLSAWQDTSWEVRLFFQTHLSLPVPRESDCKFHLSHVRVGKLRQEEEMAEDLPFPKVKVDVVEENSSSCCCCCVVC